MSEQLVQSREECVLGGRESELRLSRSRQSCLPKREVGSCDEESLRQGLGKGKHTIAPRCCDYYDDDNDNDESSLADPVGASIRNLQFNKRRAWP